MFKKSLYLFGLLFLGMTLLTQAVQSQQLKIGYVDMQRLQAGYKEFVVSQDKYDQQRKIWQDRYSTLRAEILTMREELQRQSNVLNEAKKKEKEQQIDAKIEEYQKFDSTIAGPGGEDARLQEELLKPLMEKIDTAIRLVALRDGYSLILKYTETILKYTEASDVLFADEKMDVSDKVLALLNKQ